MFKVKLLSENAVVPTRGSVRSAGWDLYSAEDVAVKSCSRILIKTDLSISLPEGCYARVAPRSGLSLQDIDVCAGVVDGDYRGNIGVILHNHNLFHFYIKKGDRIAQLILEKYETIELEEVEELDETERGGGGFGSTGN